MNSSPCQASVASSALGWTTVLKAMTVMLMLPVSTFRLLMLVTATLVSQAVIDECAQVRPSNYVVVRVFYMNLCFIHMN